MTLAAGLERRAFDDRVAIAINAARWWPGERFSAGRFGLAWRSSTTSDRPRATARGGWQRVGDATPLDLWPGAGTGHARDALLRAHPLLEDGIVTGSAFGRTLAHATVELLAPIRHARPVRIDVAAFADIAKASRPIAPFHIDVGGGVRLGLPGHTGDVRFDLARGLRDGRTTFSVGWQRAWPGL